MVSSNFIYAECIGKADTDPIELFPNVIKNICDEEIGYRAGYISEMALNIPSFESIVDNSTGLRKNWKCAFSTNRIYSDTLILNLLRESACILFPNEYNLLTIIPLQKSSLSATITTDDLCLNSDKQFVLAISKMKYSSTFNSFVLNYCFDYTNLTGRSKNYLLQEFVNPNSTSLIGSENTYGSTTYTDLCNASLLNAKSILNLTFNANYIRERATAVKLLQWLVLWNSIAKYQVEFQCHYNLNTAFLEIGDQLKININLLPDDVVTNSNFLITHISSDYLNSKIKIRAIELAF